MCAPKCSSCEYNIVKTSHEVCPECVLRGLDKCSKCNKHSSALYGRSKKCANCAHGNFRQGWCGTCGLYSEFLNSSNSCPECESTNLWDVFSDKTVTQCVVCQNWRPTNAEDVCMSCFTHAAVERVFDTCDACGKASSTRTCLNCNESAFQCYKCDTPFIPNGDEVICYSCSRSCRICGIGLERHDVELCQECSIKAVNNLCTICGEYNKTLDRLGRCISCKPVLCPACKINTLNDGDYLCTSCLQGRTDANTS